MSVAFRVDFMIVGAQKCGTTTLDQILRSHPSVVGCTEKEPHFFSTSPDWRTELPNYERLFPRRDGALYFEASTTYTFYPHRKLELWDDLHAFNPDLKIIYVVRDPIERVTSAYMHLYERGYVESSFEKAVVDVPILLDVTRYASQIAPFIRRFGAERVRILFFDDLVHAPQAVARDVAAFLGIDPDGFTRVHDIHANRSLGGQKRHHRHDRSLLLRVLRRVASPRWRALTDISGRAFSEKPILAPPLERALLHMLRSEIDELEAFTGRNLNPWRRSSALPAGATRIAAAVNPLGR